MDQNGYRQLAIPSLCVELNTTECEGMAFASGGWGRGIVYSYLDLYLRAWVYIRMRLTVVDKCVLVVA